MREYVTPIILTSALNLFAQFPPIDLEWSALRPFGEGYAQIAHDPVIDDYIWAVSDLNPPADELVFPFLADGTDLAPSYPSAFNVGSLDGLIEMAKVDGAIHSIMSHMTVGGNPQDLFWHLDNISIQSPDPWLADVGLDLLVTDDAVYGCGSSTVSISPDAWEGRLLKTDLQGNLIWDISWAPGPLSVPGRFSSVAVIGDSVFCAAFPILVIFNSVDGALIDAYDMLQSLPVVSGEAHLLAHGSRLYWVMQQGDVLHYGQFDFAAGQGQVGTESAPGQAYPAHIAIDQYGNCWISTNGAGEGRWYRFDADLEPLSSGTLYSSINHMVFMNGKLSFTGKLDATSSASYVITGTPQP